MEMRCCGRRVLATKVVALTLTVTRPSTNVSKTKSSPISIECIKQDIGQGLEKNFVMDLTSKSVFRLRTDCRFGACGS